MQIPPSGSFEGAGPGRYLEGVDAADAVVGAIAGAAGLGGVLACGHVAPPGDASCVQRTNLPRGCDRSCRRCHFLPTGVVLGFREALDQGLAVIGHESANSFEFHFIFCSLKPTNDSANSADPNEGEAIQGRGQARPASLILSHTSLTTTRNFRNILLPAFLVR